MPRIPLTRLVNTNPLMLSKIKLNYLYLFVSLNYSVLVNVPVQKMLLCKYQSHPLLNLVTIDFHIYYFHQLNMLYFQNPKTVSESVLEDTCLDIGDNSFDELTIDSN